MLQKPCRFPHTARVSLFGLRQLDFATAGLLQVTGRAADDAAARKSFTLTRHDIFASPAAQRLLLQVTCCAHYGREFPHRRQKLVLTVTGGAAIFWPTENGPPRKTVSAYKYTKFATARHFYSPCAAAST